MTKQSKNYYMAQSKTVNEANEATGYPFLPFLHRIPIGNAAAEKTRETSIITITRIEHPEF